MLKIKIRVIRNYGRSLAYPADDKAVLLAKLVGQASFSAKQIELIKQLGFEIEYEPVKM